MIHIISPSDIYSSKEVVDQFITRNNLRIIDFRPPIMGDYFIGNIVSEAKKIVEIELLHNIILKEPRFIVKHENSTPNWWE